MDHPLLVRNLNGTMHPHFVIIDRVALAKQGDNALGSVRLFVCLFAGAG